MTLEKILDSSHAFCACNNVLFYLFIWFSAIMFKVIYK